MLNVPFFQLTSSGMAVVLRYSFNICRSFCSPGLGGAGGLEDLVGALGGLKLVGWSKIAIMSNHFP